MIFTASVQHAAVNFPQVSIMSYAPAMPLANFQPAPTSKTGATHDDYLKLLPPLDLAELQMDMGYMLGSVHYTTLGHYAEGHFADPRVAAPLREFQSKLEEISNLIDERNKAGIPTTRCCAQGIRKASISECARQSNTEASHSDHRTHIPGGLKLGGASSGTLCLAPAT